MRPAEQSSIELRRARFGRVVATGLADAKERGLTIPMIEKLTKCGKSTFYRWRDGDWSIDPRITEVRNFCDGLGIPRATAYAALGWSEDVDRDRIEPEPAMDPVLRAVGRLLSDPNVSLLEKVAIQSQLDYIVKRKLAPGED